MICVNSISLGRKLLMINQDRSIDTRKYSCIVKFIFLNTACTGVFVSKNILITAQHCITQNNSIIYINNDETRDYEVTTHDKNFYDVGIIKFNKFSYKCYPYFKLNPNLNLTFGPHKFRACGYGRYNTSNSSTDKDFGCRDYNNIHLSGMRDVYFNTGESMKPGDSGAPLFTTVNNINYIHAITFGGSLAYHENYFYKINQSYFDWCIDPKSKCMTENNLINNNKYFILFRILFNMWSK